MRTFRGTPASGGVAIVGGAPFPPVDWLFSTYTSACPLGPQPLEARVDAFVDDAMAELASPSAAFPDATATVLD